MQPVRDWLVKLENAIHRVLVRGSASALRLAVGVVFLGFGLLKFFPGVSPVEDLTARTIETLSLGLISGWTALAVAATLECFIGLCLLWGRFMRLAIWLLAFHLLAILTPLALFPNRLFGGPMHAPTLEGQYVLKDVILVAAGTVIAASSFRGGRLIRQEPSQVPVRTGARRSFNAEQKLQIVLGDVRHDHAVADICATHGISEDDYYQWRDRLLEGATEALAQDERSGARRR